MKTSTLRPSASLLLLAACALIAVPSCSSTQDQARANTYGVTVGGLMPPHLETAGTSSSPENSGSQYVIVNPNQRTTLSVDYIRQMPDLARSMTSRVNVPPGQSVVIGSRTMNGSTCTYELSGWDETGSARPAAKVAKNRPAHVSPIVASVAETE